ncbi:hypothetical protein ACP275_11G021300 [Erythranthe tilingii]
MHINCLPHTEVLYIYISHAISYNHHIILYHSSQTKMDNKLQMVTLLMMLLIFASGVAVCDAEGKKKNCYRHRMTSRCMDEEICEARACAISCQGAEDFQCGDNAGNRLDRCYCLYGCNSTSPAAPPPPPPPHRVFPRRCILNHLAT